MGRNPLLLVFAMIVAMILIARLTTSFNPQTPQPSEDKSSQSSSIHQTKTGDFILQRYANYCNDAAEKTRNHWLHYTACEKSAEVVIALFTFALAIATIGLIFVGVRQEMHFHNTAKKELRAYLCIRNAEKTYNLPTGVLRAFVEILNTGKTPAHKVHPALFAEMRAPNSNKPFDEVIPMPHRQPIAPGSQWSIGYEFNDASPDDVSAVIANRKLVYMWGCIKYEDIFRQSRELRFRLRNVVKQIRPTEQGIKIERWSLLQKTRATSPHKAIAPNLRQNCPTVPSFPSLHDSPPCPPVELIRSTTSATSGHTTRAATRSHLLAAGPLNLDTCEHGERVAAIPRSELFCSPWPHTRNARNLMWPTRGKGPRWNSSDTWPTTECPRSGKAQAGSGSKHNARQSRATWAGGRKLVAEYTEVETGKGSDALDKRPQLREAIATAKRHRAALLIAKLDRLARNVHFITGLQESKVKFTAVDMPEASELVIHLMAAMAQHEARMISERTKAALAAKRARGEKLGNPNPHLLKQGNKVRARKARVFAAGLRTTLDALQAQGLTQRAIVVELNKLGVKAPQGGAWHRTQLQRVLARA